MKTLINTALPALALLALGGCATTGAVSSTEPDDVYFSSKDKVTYAAPAAGTGYQSSGYQPNGYGSATTQTQVPASEDANPDYQGGNAQQGTSTDYYDDNYTSYNSVQPSGFGQPYTGPGVSTYNYTPSWSVAPMAYASPFGYGTGLSIGYGYGGFGGYSPFGYGYGYPGYGGFYDPFYSSFYSPFGYGYGSGLSIGFGYGFGGFGGFGYPYGGFGSPYRYGGYGYPGYAYGGGYGGGYGDYGYGRGGARNYVYKQGIMNGSYSNGYDPGAIKVGRRESRYSNAVGSSGAVAPGGASGAGQFSNRRAAAAANSGFDRVVAPGGNAPAANGMTNNGQPAAATMDRSRRFDQNMVNPNSPGAAGAYNQPRAAEVANPGGAQPQRRGGFFREVFANPNPNGGQPQSQNNGYAQPQQRNFDQQQRTFSQPQRTFQQPQQRSFEQPRMEQRSFSPAPSFGGGGGGGGGSFGGGGGGGGGRRGR
jgi:hypothetical protein